MTHTPGPWKYHVGSARLMVGSDTKSIALVGDVPYWSKYTETDLANAKLIARAPDLLAENERLKAINAELLGALKEIMLAHTADAEDAMPGDDKDLAWEQARAAIQKATTPNQE